MSAQNAKRSKRRDRQSAVAPRSADGNVGREGLSRALGLRHAKHQPEPVPDRLRHRDGPELGATFHSHADETGLSPQGSQTKRFELTAKTLDLGYHFLRSNRLVDQAMPYLMHLCKETEETVNLTMLEDTEIIFVSRFLSRHVLNTDVIVGTRMPAFCTAPGIAMLSRLPEDEADRDHRSFGPEADHPVDDVAVDDLLREAQAIPGTGLCHRLRGVLPRRRLDRGRCP